MTSDFLRSSSRSEWTCSLVGTVTMIFQYDVDIGSCLTAAKFRCSQECQFDQNRIQNSLHGRILKLEFLRKSLLLKISASSQDIYRHVRESNWQAINHWLICFLVYDIRSPKPSANLIYQHSAEQESMTINHSGNPSINLVAQSKYDPEWIPGAHSKERDKGNAEEAQAANERAISALFESIGARYAFFYNAVAQES